MAGSVETIEDFLEYTHGFRWRFDAETFRPNLWYHILLFLCTNHTEQYAMDEIAAMMPLDVEAPMVLREIETLYRVHQSLAIELFDIEPLKVTDTMRLRLTPNAVTRLRPGFRKLEGHPIGAILPESFLPRLDDKTAPPKPRYRMGANTESFHFQVPQKEDPAIVYDCTRPFRLSIELFRKFANKDPEPRHMLGRIVHWKTRYLQQKAGVPSHTIMVSAHFDPLCTKAAECVPGIILLTLGDYVRFLDFDAAADRPPTLHDWVDLLSVQGVATYRIIDICRKRMKQQ